MRYKGNFLARAIALLSFGSLLRSTAEACLCTEPTAQEAFDQADVVFAGTAVAVTHEPPCSTWVDATGRKHVEYSSGLLRWTFRVAAWWKGTAADSLHIYSRGSTAACGFNFKVGSDYLVYAELKRGLKMRTGPRHSDYALPAALATGLCCRNALLNEAYGDLHVLQAPLGRNSRWFCAITPITLDAMMDSLRYATRRGTLVAAKALCTVRPPNLLDSLTTVLSDGSFNARFAALDALRCLGSSAAAAEPAIRRATADRDPSISFWATDLLDRLKTQPAK